jgi:hypothetical protein
MDEPLSLGVKCPVSIPSGSYLMKLTAIIEAEGDGYVSLCPSWILRTKGIALKRPGTTFGKRWSLDATRQGRGKAAQLNNHSALRLAGRLGVSSLLR